MLSLRLSDSRIMPTAPRLIHYLDYIIASHSYTFGQPTTMLLLYVYFRYCEIALPIGENKGLGNNRQDKHYWG